MDKRQREEYEVRMVNEVASVISIRKIYDL